MNTLEDMIEAKYLQFSLTVLIYFYRTPLSATYYICSIQNIRFPWTNIYLFLYFFIQLSMVYTFYLLHIPWKNISIPC